MLDAFMHIPYMHAFRMHSLSANAWPPHVAHYAAHLDSWLLLLKTGPAEERF